MLIYRCDWCGITTNTLQSLIKVEASFLGKYKLTDLLEIDMELQSENDLVMHFCPHCFQKTFHRVNLNMR